MHCYAFEMYLKDVPLRSSEFIAMHSKCISKTVQNVLVCIMLYQEDGPLRSSNYFFAKCML